MLRLEFRGIMILKKVRSFVYAHMDFKIYPATWTAIIVALAVVPCVMFLPDKYGYENGLLENLQLLALLVGFIFAIKSKVNKKFFYFAALVIGILALREVNCGRVLFFPVPGEVNSFYGWKDIKYGWLAHPLYGLYMAFAGIYFLKNKLFITLWKIVKDIKFPVWILI